MSDKCQFGETVSVSNFSLKCTFLNMTTMNESVAETTMLLQDESNYILGQRSFIKPMFGEYQLLGDSLLMHFSGKILHHHYTVKNGIRSVGYCVSGQRIDQLRHRVKLRTYPLSSKMMVLIGTNDVLRGENINTMTKHFTTLMNLLRKSADKILILTLPPIPKLCVTFYHWTLIRQYNDFLKSFDDGRSILVADICPLFTKFKGALEYNINVSREPKSDSTKKRRPRPNSRKNCFSEQKKPFGAGSDESDYKNTTDSNNSIASEITSSELSQGKENIDIDDVQDERSTPTGPKSPDRVHTPNRLVVKTFQSVFGKDVFNRKKKAVQDEKSKSESMKLPEKRLRKNSPERNDELRSTDSWIVESDEDSMNGHVYNSQEEIEYDLSDLGSEKKKKRSGEFSKYVESSNKMDETPKRNCTRRKHSYVRNDKPDETDSSSSSSEYSSPKKRIYPFIDNDFQFFVESSSLSSGQNDCSVESSVHSHHSPRNCHSSPNSPFESYSKNSFRRLFRRSHGCRKFDGVSGKDKLIIHLASKICHLNCYELFYRFDRTRMDMIHLNYNGLNELKNFLISKNYVSI
ncbi:UNVERIFIED_CONTAM: hypothetical protein PYX00_009518 [Menopon gallinae]|uniref:OSK domain-containing protein n=1 Tax=Menopon gallinae TaxID=328185 RepID=A0AAW2HBM0_9NEOP